jgi:hypothetical protein
MPENNPPRASPGADRGTQLGAGTRVLTRVFTVFLLPVVALGRIMDEIGRMLSLAAAAVAGGLRRIARGLLASIRAILDPLTEIGRRFGLLLRRVGADLAVLVLRAVFAVFRPVVRAGRWLGPLLRRVLTVVLLPVVAATWFAALARRTAPARLIGRHPRLALGVSLIAAVTITAEASPSSHSSSYPLFVVLGLGFLLALVALLLVALRRIFALVVTVVRLPFVLLNLLLVAAAELVRRALEPLIASLRQIAEWIRLVGQRLAHSLNVAISKAAFQATRRLHALPGAPPGAVPSNTQTDPPVPFHATVYQNEYLPQGGVEVNAIVTVTAADGTGSANGKERRTPEAAEVILLDCSGSMAYPLSKLRAAQKATAAAIDSMREGTWFALVRATERAELMYPPGGGLAQMSPATRKAAKRALSLTWPEGGTAMGEWLMLARELLASRRGSIAHAILLTDGRNESESHDALESALAACAGQFQCDCRGVGTDWRVKELRAIASQLLGTVDIVAEPTALEADFRSMTKAAMAKTVGNVALRVWTPHGATVVFVKQVSPTIEDLTSRAASVDTLTADYPTGAWGNESRDYHVCVRVPSKEIDDEMLAARVSMVVGAHTASQVLVRAIWTDDEQLSTQINREVAHYTGQAELAEVIQEGLQARRSGDEQTATFKLGRAVQLAGAAGNDATMKLLASVVDVQDQATATVRLKRQVDDAHEMALDTRSTKTIRVQKNPRTMSTTCPS